MKYKNSIQREQKKLEQVRAIYAHNNFHFILNELPWSRENQLSSLELDFKLHVTFSCS